jgi:hypothetical protein
VKSSYRRKTRSRFLRDILRFSIAWRSGLCRAPQHSVRGGALAGSLWFARGRGGRRHHVDRRVRSTAEAGSSLPSSPSDYRAPSAFHPSRMPSNPREWPRVASEIYAIGHGGCTWLAADARTRLGSARGVGPQSRETGPAQTKGLANPAPAQRRSSLKLEERETLTLCANCGPGPTRRRLFRGVPSPQIAEPPRRRP